jgi:DNA polymerase-3 subunit alpha
MSYGVIVYQDDVLMISIKLAGYSWLEADKLRKAMGKKIPKEMQGEKDKLLAGFIKNGMTEKKAGELWKLIEPFAAYGFGKAHAASYGRVAYQTSYMKANFPAIYMSAVLSADSGEIEKIAESITACKRMGIPILPPDINESFSQFTVIEGAEGKSDIIRFGLVTIKNFGQGIATAIIAERKKPGPTGGKFKSLANFLDRIKDRNLNKKSLEALIKVGALDSFGHDRGVLLGNVENLLAYNKEQEKQHDNQDSLFGLMSDTSSVPTLKLIDVPPATVAEKLAWERDLLGLYISGHPLDRFRPMIEKQKLNIAKIKATAEKEVAEGAVPEKSTADEADKKRPTPVPTVKVKAPYKPYDRNAARQTKPEDVIVIAGIVDEVRPVTTKKGEPMLFIKMSDFTGTIEAVVFPRVYREFRTLFTPEQCIAIKGKISDRNGEKSIIIDRAKKLA